MGEEFYSRHFYKRMEDMEEGLRIYVDTITSLDHIWIYMDLFHMKSWKVLLGGGTSKSFEVCNNLPLNKILNFDTNENVRGTIKDERLCSHPI